MTQPLDIVKRALRIVGALASGENPGPDTANDVFDMCNDMVDQWSNSPLMIPYKTEVISTLIPGQYVYTIGTGAQINTPRPLRINSAFVRVANLDYRVEILNVEQYELFGMKTLNGPWPRALYYQPTSPNGVVTFWPNPSSGEIHLFADTVLTRFATINDTINLPQGYEMAMRWNLAELILPEFGKNDPVIGQMVAKQAADGRAFIKRTNMQPVQTARFDPALLRNNRKDAGWIMHGGFN